MEGMLRAGMNVARLNFSHGDFTQHAEVVQRLRAASAATGCRVAIMADLPGPKMRLGELPGGPYELQAGAPFTLTTEKISGDERRAHMTFATLPRVVHPGHRLYLNDGLVQLTVDRVEGGEVHCTVAVGGVISSRKGLNLPNIPLGIHAFTDRDRECLEFALRLGVDAVSQSFVETAEDIREVREAAAALGAHPFLIAKIERAGALKNYEEILAATDGVMVARGDLGVEVPIEEMAVIQKRLIAAARQARRPVITATQMLESMTTSRLPTRAEATDVANAILDGTDCVMLSAESAAGLHPVASVEMLGKIARATEAYLDENNQVAPLEAHVQARETPFNRKALLVEYAVALQPCDAVLVPTSTGATGRAVARWRPKPWVLAVSPNHSSCQHLAFSYGVHPVLLEEMPESWNELALDLCRRLELPAREVLLVAGPSPRNPEANQRLELIVIDKTNLGEEIDADRWENS